MLKYLGNSQITDLFFRKLLKNYVENKYSK